MWVVERCERAAWRVVARCKTEQEADIVLAALRLANSTAHFRKREETFP
jgi:hypothetical protein